MIFGFPPFTRRFSDEEISRICDVSLSTVYRWRTGRQSVPNACKRLLDLEASGRVIPDDWDGFRFDDGKLWTNLDFSLQRVEIEQFQLYLSFLRNTARTNERLQEYVDYLEKVTPRAKVIPFDRSRCRSSLTDGKEDNGLFNKPENA